MSPAPGKILDDMDPYRTSTKRPHMDWHQKLYEDPFFKSIESKKMRDQLESNFKSHLEEDLRRRDRIVNSLSSFHNTDFKPVYVPPTPPSLGSARTRVRMFRVIGSIVGGILLLMFFACAAARKKKVRTGRVLATGAIVAPAPRAVQQQPQTHMRPPGQGPGPANIDPPPSYSDVINKTVTEEPPSLLTYTEAQLHNNRPVEIGFKNECNVTTSSPYASGDPKTEFVFDNGRVVARPGLKRNKETGHGTNLFCGTRRADGRDNVVYIDEKSKAVL